ncbi:peptidase S41 [Novosphingobium profundi]|uniref:S41 family peptidase n=1 Tax=Novosphingobium profundi TaxID=1774954 RepID=UPI001BDB67BF|nr:S41 family peptidase [Novosphingobium profundi]MBT0667931.1 peptidase S41 [Novosphingobium profundi]
MRSVLLPSWLALSLVLAGCGGGGSGSASSGGTSATPTPSPTPTPTPTATGSACALADRDAWALAQLQEWYLFPDLLDTTVDPAAYSSLQDYIDAVVAPARAQSKDRYFTYVTSIAEENAYYASGETAGLGVRLGFDATSARLFVIEAYETGPAYAKGFARGTEIVAIGTSTSNLQSVSSLYASGGVDAISAAMGGSSAGTTRVFQIRQLDSTLSTVSVTKKTFTLDPLSPTYGYKVLTSNGRKVGYVNLRTFVTSAETALREAFAAFRAQGVSEVVVDLRYNGGGLISVANTFSNLLNAGRTGQVLSYTSFRPSKSSNDETAYFATEDSAIAATRVAFIASSGTASASELVMNAQKPYLPSGAALIGTNTYGKPVGQVGLDYTACDDRLRVVALKTENADHEGDYYTGLAANYPATCQAGDDISYALGDPQEASLKAALGYLNGESCTAIGATTSSASARTSAQSLSTSSLRAVRQPLEAKDPNFAQRELPGLF